MTPTFSKEDEAKAKMWLYIAIKKEQYSFSMSQIVNWILLLC